MTIIFVVDAGWHGRSKIFLLLFKKHLSQFLSFLFHDNQRNSNLIFLTMHSNELYQLRSALLILSFQFYSPLQPLKRTMISSGSLRSACTEVCFCLSWNSFYLESIFMDGNLQASITLTSVISRINCALFACWR